MMTMTERKKQRGLPTHAAKRLLVLAIGLGVAAASQAQTRMLLLGWNVESGDNQVGFIAQQLAALEGYDLIGLTEVRSGNTQRYADAVKEGEGAYGKASQFNFHLGTTGRSDRIMMIWDEDRFRLHGRVQELTEVQASATYRLNDGNHRSPLTAQFEIINTGERFWFMVNHLARGNEALRQEQAKGLVVWASQQTLPVLAIGDYNFDYNIDDGRGNQAFRFFMRGQVFEWVRPQRLYKTSLNPRYNGILDFVFIANRPSNWEVSSSILTDNLFADFQPPDDEQKSDHRPVEGRVLIWN